MTDLLAALTRRWPPDDPIQLTRVIASDAGAQLYAVAECAGWGLCHLEATLAEAHLEDIETMVEAARAQFRAARQRLEAAWQAQWIEA